MTNEENTVPLGSYELKCPCCGGGLTTTETPVTDQARVFCKVDGDIGSYGELKGLALEQNREEVEKRATRIAADMLRDMLKK